MKENKTQLKAAVGDLKQISTKGNNVLAIKMRGIPPEWRLQEWHACM